MSLNIAISSAVSSLLVLERQMSVASSNIANADVDGYTAKSVQLDARVTSGAGTGVDISGITSTINQFLLKDIAAAASQSSADSTTSDYYTSLQGLLGEVSSSTSGDDLSSLITSLSTSLQNLESTPDDSSLKSQFVSDLDSLAAKLRSTSAGIQSLRTDADQQISDDISDVNSSLDTIKDLNTQITKAAARGEPTADLEDKRNTALQTIAGKMDVSYFVDGQNQVHVYTIQGQALLDGTVVSHLSHNSAAAISDGVTYDPASGNGISGIYVAGTDITSQIKSGSIGALIDMRDDTLPKAQAELDALASTLSSALNGDANLGSSSPPPSTLTGTKAVTATDAVTVASGTTLRVALTDPAGKITSFQDLDLSSTTTVQDILDDLNSVSGVTASISGGTLTISSASGIAISTLSGSLNGTDVSSNFGLNDLLTGGSSALTISVRADLLANPTSLPTGKLSQAASLTIGNSAIGSSDASTATSLYSTLTGTTSFSAAGWLGAKTSSFSQYAADLISGIATQTSTASTASDTSSATLTALQSSFSNQSGVNTDEQTAWLSQLENYYAASAKVISTANAMFESLISAIAS
jgi:flagellar hook-associated protein 1 FlgK